MRILRQDPPRVAQRIPCPAPVEVQVRLVLLHTQRVILLHVLMVYRRIVRQVLQVRRPQLLDVLPDARLQLLVLLILSEGSIRSLRRIIVVHDVQHRQRVPQHSPRQSQRVVSGSHPLGSRACQHPQVVQFLVLALQLIHILQDGQQLLFRLHHVRSHPRIVLSRHILQELVEVLRVSLSNLQCVQHPHRLLNVIVLVRCQVRSVRQRLIGRHKLPHRLVVFQVQCSSLRQVRATHRNQQNHQKIQTSLFHFISHKNFQFFNSSILFMSH